jgi:hypothetical protein
MVERSRAEVAASEPRPSGPQVHPHYAAVDGSTLPISNHLAVHPLRLLDSTQWQGHPSAGLVRLLQDVANLDDERQHRIAAAAFDEAGRIIFG